MGAAVEAAVLPHLLPTMPVRKSYQGLLAGAVQLHPLQEHPRSVSLRVVMHAVVNGRVCESVVYERAERARTAGDGRSTPSRFPSSASNRSGGLEGPGPEPGQHGACSVGLELLLWQQPEKQQQWQ